MAGDMFEAVHGSPERQSQFVSPATPENRFYGPLVVPEFVIFTTSLPLQLDVSDVQVSEFAVTAGPSQSYAELTPVYCRSPRKAQRSPLTSDDEQVVVQKKVRMSVLRSNSNRSDSDA